MRVYTSQGVTPTRIRGTKQMNRAQGLPRSRPGTGMKGENTKEERPGTSVFLIMLDRPNIPPRNAPFLGPSRMEPMMTGTWRMVALITGRSIRPRGVKVSKKMMPVNIARMAIPCTCLLR